MLELQQGAIEALRGCLRSENDMVRLRASLSVLEKVASLTVGSTDSEEVQRDQIQAIKLRRICEIQDEGVEMGGSTKISTAKKLKVSSL